MTFENELLLAKEVARKAGDYLRTSDPVFSSILTDTRRDLKLAADMKSEEVILRMLRARSDYPILSEECGFDGRDDSGKDSRMWIVDPLDGTVNYSRNIPLCCVSIGLWENNKPILGAVYDLNTGDMYTGLVGAGAWCNEKDMHVSAINKRNNAILATGFPVNRDFVFDPLTRFVEAVANFKKIRLFGSAALSLAYLARSRVDVYMEEEIMLWDVAAGIAIVEAAGGCTVTKPSTRHQWARTVTAASTKTLLSSSTES